MFHARDRAGVAPGDRREAGRKLVAQRRHPRCKAARAGDGVDVVETLACSRRGLLESGRRGDELHLGRDELGGCFDGSPANSGRGCPLGLDRPSELGDLGDRRPCGRGDERALLALQRRQLHLARRLLVGQQGFLVAQTLGPRGRLPQSLGCGPRRRIG